MPYFTALGGRALLVTGLIASAFVACSDSKDDGADFDDSSAGGATSAANTTAATSASDSGNTASTTSSSTSSNSASSNSASATGTTSAAATSSGTDGGSTTSASTSAGGTTGETSASATTGGVSSQGCGASEWPEAGAQTLDVGGVEREYIFSLASGYDASTPQRLVFAFHGRTGTADQIANGFGGGYYGLESRMENTIFVAPQGLGTDEDPEDTGWPNDDGRDIDFVEAMLEYFESNFCIDSARIFSVGFSYGGIMSNTIACQLGSRFRAVAPMAGALFSFGQDACLDEPVAAWFAHGSEDTSIYPEQGETARDALLERNGCSSESEPVEPSPCVAYQGCSDGYPVHWCLFEGPHTIPDFAGEAVSNFFLSF